MSWSTSEVAELAGATVNMVRHYHRIGLLDEPERLSNGYKQYGVTHLVSLLRIRRLIDLGVPLAAIGEVGSGADRGEETLRTLSSEIQRGIAHLQKVESEIGAILTHRAPADSPLGFEAVASRLSDADRSMIHIYTQLYDRDALTDLRQMAEDDSGFCTELGELAPDADETTRQRLIDWLAPVLVKSLLHYPRALGPSPRRRKSAIAATEMLVDAMRELYNPAQLDVLTRAGTLARERAQALRSAGDGSTPDHSPRNSVHRKKPRTDQPGLMKTLNTGSQ